MNQFGAYSLSPPRGPDCCVSTRYPWPINIRFQDPAFGASIGICQDCGFILVPDAVFIRYIPASFICMPWLMPWSIPAIFE